MAAANGPKRSTSKKKNTWSTVEFNDVPAEHQHLSLRQKDDREDLSGHLVRNRRFRSSYMMATNGGATYEDILRTPRRTHIAAFGQVGLSDYGDVARHSRFKDDADLAADHLGEMPHGYDNVIGPRDDRVHIDDTSRIPARSVGLLEITPSVGPLRYGTAWLIGPRTLATAAHNLIHPQAGRAKRMRVGIACDGNSARGGWHKIIDNKFDVSWPDNMEPGSPLDFAVLKIEDREVGEKLGWFGFADYQDAKFGDMIVNIFGYPLDRRRFHMYGSAGRVKSVDEGRIFYDCDAGGGMSGGPVIARFGEQRIAVGVHVSGGVVSNVGTRINDAAYRLFADNRDW